MRNRFRGSACRESSGRPLYRFQLDLDRLCRSGVEGGMETRKRSWDLGKIERFGDAISGVSFIVERTNYSNGDLRTIFVHYDSSDRARLLPGAAGQRSRFHALGIARKDERSSARDNDE